MTQVRPPNSRRATAPLCRLGGVATALLASLMLQACSPALDWRQVRPEGWQLQLDLPCRPATQTRLLPLAGAPVELTLLACSVDKHTFALASTDLQDPGRVGPALRALGQAARANVQGQVEQKLAARVKGMTPQADALQWRLRGQRPDGQAVQAQVLVFAHGTRVFQATLIGAVADDRMTKPFFGSVEVLP